MILLTLRVIPKSLLARTSYRYLKGRTARFPLVAWNFFPNISLWQPNFKPDFNMSGKSQTFGDFTVSRTSQIFRIMKTRNRRHRRSSGMVGEKTGEAGAFLFSQCIPDFCDGQRSRSRQMQPQICTVGDVSDGFLLLPIPHIFKFFFVTNF